MTGAATERPRWRVGVASAALVAAVLLFGRVSVLYLADPVAAAARSGIVLGSPDAVNNLRVAGGGFHLGVALVAAVGLVRPRFAKPALLFLVIMLTAITGTRWAGLFAHGLAPHLSAILEAGALVIVSVGLWAAYPFGSVVAEDDR